MKAISLFVSAALFASIICFGTVASAISGYVCYIQMRTHPTLGDHGFAYVSFYSEPFCEGDYQDSYYICTEGATYSACSASSFDYLSGPAFTAVTQNLYLAATEGNEVRYYEILCNDDDPDCLGNYYLYSRE